MFIGSGNVLCLQQIPKEKLGFTGLLHLLALLEKEPFFSFCWKN